MISPESYYLSALKSALQGNLSNALELQYKAEKSREKFGYSFSEGISDEFPFIEEVLNTLLSSYDFTRCVRPDGSAYGTRGKCRKGSQQAKPKTETQERLEGHKDSLKRMTSLHNEEANYNASGVTLQRASAHEKKILEDEAKLLKDHPEMASSILKHAQKQAESRDKQARDAVGKMDQLPQVSRSKADSNVLQWQRGGSGGTFGRARAMDHTASMRRMQAEFHRKRAKQAMEAMEANG